MHIEKGRTLFGEVAQTYETSLETDDQGKQFWQVNDMAGDSQSEFIALIRDGKSDIEIGEILRCDRTTAFRRRKSAKANGLI